MLRLYELSRRPWEGRTQEERERIARYETFCARAAVKAQEQETQLLLKKK